MTVGTSVRIYSRTLSLVLLLLFCRRCCAAVEDNEVNQKMNHGDDVLPRVEALMARAEEVPYDSTEYKEIMGMVRQIQTDLQQSVARAPTATDVQQARAQLEATTTENRRLRGVAGRQTAAIINANYTSDQKGHPIRDEDTIRAANGIWYTQAEIKAFRNKSTAWCPTYGNCPYCYRMGPVGGGCSNCRHRRNFEIISYANRYHDNEASTTNQRIIDAHYITSLMEAPTEFAVPDADCTYEWLSTPCHCWITSLHSRQTNPCSYWLSTQLQ